MNGKSPKIFNPSSVRPDSKDERRVFQQNQASGPQRITILPSPLPSDRG